MIATRKCSCCRWRKRIKRTGGAWRGNTRARIVAIADVRQNRMWRSHAMQDAGSRTRVGPAAGSRTRTNGKRLRARRPVFSARWAGTMTKRGSRPWSTSGPTCTTGATTVATTGNTGTSGWPATRKSAWRCGPKSSGIVTSTISSAKSGALKTRTPQRFVSQPRGADAKILVGSSEPQRLYKSF